MRASLDMISYEKNPLLPEKQNRSFYSIRMRIVLDKNGRYTLYDVMHYL